MIIQPPPYAESAVLIAGGTAGTGLASALDFAHAGVRRLALVGRDADRAEQARATVLAAYPSAHVLALPADAGDPDALHRVVDTTRSTFGELAVAVSAVAPAVLPELVVSSSRADLGRHLAEVALPPIHLAHAVLEVMRPQGFGSVVLVASDAAKVPTPGEAIVGAGMAAVAMYARVAALEEKVHGVRINVVTPSLVHGTATTYLLMANDFASQLFAKARERATLGTTEVGDVAALVTFLGGPHAARITGQAVSINGGLSAF